MPINRGPLMISESFARSENCDKDFNNMSQTFGVHEELNHIRESTNMDVDFEGSPGAASPASFSCRSVVCSRVESWGQIWNRSQSPKLAEVSSVEDLKQALKSKRIEVIQERSSTENLTTYRGRSSEEAFSPREEEGNCPEV
jgi:hypothetical protein